MSKESFPGQEHNNANEQLAGILTDEQILKIIEGFKILEGHTKWMVSFLKNKDNPEEAIKAIEETLVSEEVPMVEKTMLIFEIMFPTSRIEEEANRVQSPYLNEMVFEKGSFGDKVSDLDKLHEIVHRDLLNINIKSNNDSLRQYLHGSADINSILELLGVNSREDVLEEMGKVVSIAHERGLKIAEQIRNKTFKFENDCLVRGVDRRHFGDILQNGDVSYEYHGWNSHPDIYSPFDVDFFKLEENTKETDFENKYVLEKRERDKGNLFVRKDDKASEGCPWYYGSIVLYLKDRGQWQDTTHETINSYIPTKESLERLANYNPAKLELFHVRGGVGDQHFGMRTGYPSTEIDLIVVPSDKYPADYRPYLDKNSWYIPVVDKDLNLIYTPEMYEESRGSKKDAKRKGLISRGLRFIWNKT